MHVDLTIGFDVFAIAFSISRLQANGSLAIGTDRPMVPPADALTLTFVLRVTDAPFANYTELGPATTGFYRFGNDSQNRTAGVNFLSSRAATFDATRRYAAGEVFLQAATPTFNLFVALRDTGPSATPVAADWKRIPADTFNATATYRTGTLVLSANALFRALIDNPGTDLTNAAQWQLAGVLANQYITVADAILPVSSLFDLNSGDLAVAQATVRISSSPAQPTSPNPRARK